MAMGWAGEKIDQLFKTINKLKQLNSGTNQTPGPLLLKLTEQIMLSTINIQSKAGTAETESGPQSASVAKIYSTT